MYFYYVYFLLRVFLLQSRVCPGRRHPCRPGGRGEGARGSERVRDGGAGVACVDGEACRRSGLGGIRHAVVHALAVMAARPYMRVHVHIYNNIHAHSHPHISTRTHTHTSTSTLTHTHTHIHTLTHTLRTTGSSSLGRGRGRRHFGCECGCAQR